MGERERERERERELYLQNSLIVMLSIVQNNLNRLICFEVGCLCLRKTLDGWMDGWMTCNFRSFSTVFQSYDGRLIMKGCVQWNFVYGSEDFALSGARIRDR